MEDIYEEVKNNFYEYQQNIYYYHIEFDDYPVDYDGDNIQKTLLIAFCITITVSKSASVWKVKEFSSSTIRSTVSEKIPLSLFRPPFRTLPKIWTNRRRNGSM